MVSFGGRLRDLLASLRTSSVFRSRMRTSSAMIEVTRAAIAPRAIMSAMKRRTAPRSGSTKLVIGLGSSIGDIGVLDVQHSISGSSAQLFPAKRSGDASRPSGATNRAAQLDAFEDEQQLGGLDHHVTLLRAPRSFERAFLEAFHNQNVSVTVPVQHADTIAAAGKEDVQRSRQRILGELRANEHRETVDSLPSVDARGRNEHTRPGRQRQ